MSDKPIPILYYHSVAPKKNSSWYKSYLTYELRYFVDLIHYLKRKKFEFLFLDEYFTLKDKTHRKNDKLICLTFDDGFLDNYVFVYPYLKKLQIKATIFVSPEFVPEIEQPRLTLEDVWSGAVNETQLETLGYFSWSEMLKMEATGLIDIQSHTLTHTKYFSNDKIREFHHPKSNYLYPISNQFPERKPYYITDRNFISLIPFGTPFFQEGSALTTKKVSIHPQFQAECVQLLKNRNWQSYNFTSCFNKISPLYNSYIRENKLVVDIENQLEFETRVKYELTQSKALLEEKLNKTIKHICWPHGDYSQMTHNFAREAGYQSSTIILPARQKNAFHDRFDRTGSGSVLSNRILTLQKARFKINAYRGVAPYNWFQDVYFKIRYGR